MKKVVAFFFLLFSFVMIYAAEPDSTALDSETANPIDRETCTFKGKRLYGQVQVVDCCADFKVKIVDCCADLDVQVVNCCASKCGEWQFVNCCADFTVEFVNCCADFEIKMVNCCPGIP